jgi:hypothetical protein
MPGMTFADRALIRAMDQQGRGRGMAIRSPWDRGVAEEA